MLQADTMYKALAQRIFSIYSPANDHVDADALEMHFYGTCPYLKLAHFYDSGIKQEMHLEDRRRSGWSATKLQQEVRWKLSQMAERVKIEFEI